MIVPENSNFEFASRKRAKVGSPLGNGDHSASEVELAVPDQSTAEDDSETVQCSDSTIPDTPTTRDSANNAESIAAGKRASIPSMFVESPHTPALDQASVLSDLLNTDKSGSAVETEAGSTVKARFIATGNLLIQSTLETVYESIWKASEDLLRSLSEVSDGSTRTLKLANHMPEAVEAMLPENDSGEFATPSVWSLIPLPTVVSSHLVAFLVKMIFDPSVSFGIDKEDWLRYFMKIKGTLVQSQ